MDTHPHLLKVNDEEWVRNIHWIFIIEENYNINVSTVIPARFNEKIFVT